MKNVPDQGFEATLSGNFSAVGILLHTGIVGDKDDLFVLDTEAHPGFEDFRENEDILRNFAKTTGKRWVSWSLVLVDLNFQQTGEIMVLDRFQKSPMPWKQEITFCCPNKRIDVM